MATVITKKRATEIARQARSYGYFQHSAYDISVTCPQCHTAVHTTLGYGHMSVAKELDAAMVAHLPACTVVHMARDGVDLSGVDYVTLSDALDLAPMNSPVAITLRTAYDAATTR